MLEVQRKRSLLKEIDPSTFELFSEYAYTNNYTVPDPVIALQPADVTIEGGMNGYKGKSPVSNPEAGLEQADKVNDPVVWDPIDPEPVAVDEGSAE